MHLLGWVCTRDYGCYTNEGSVYVIANVSLPIIFQGKVIRGNEIRHFLENYRIANIAFVMPVRHEIDGHHPFAFIVKSSNTRLLKGKEKVCI